MDSMLRKTFLDLKNLRWFLLVPIFTIWGLLPFLNYYSLSRFPPEIVASAVFDQAQTFIPIMASLPIIFLLRPLIEGDGHEVLYLFGRIKKYGFITILTVFLIHLILMTPIFIGYSFYYVGIWNEFFRTAVQSFVFCSLAYALTYLLKSTLAAFLGTVVFYAAMLIGVQQGFVQNEIFRIWNVFSLLTNEIPRPEETVKYAVILVLSLALFAVGIWKNKSYYR